MRFYVSLLSMFLPLVLLVIAALFQYRSNNEFLFVQCETDDAFSSDGWGAQDDSSDLYSLSLDEHLVISKDLLRKGKLGANTNEKNSKILGVISVEFCSACNYGEFLVIFLCVIDSLQGLF